MDQQQLYLELYKEYRNEIRHQETQRSAVSTICVGIAAGLIGFSFTLENKEKKVYIGYLLVNFALVAILILRKLYERFFIGRARAALFLDEIDRFPRTLDDGAVILTDSVESTRPGMRKVWTAGREKAEPEFPFMSFVRLHDLWESLLIAALLVGLFFTFHYPLFPSHQWGCLALGMAGPALQLLILAFRQWWGKSAEYTH